MSRIYVASSWRNLFQPFVVQRLREYGHEVYDFKNPKEGDHGFSWLDVNLELGQANGTVHYEPYLEALKHPRAVEGFNSDFTAMQWATHCLMVLPCGKSAHLELGWATGAGKKTGIYLEEMNTPELMYLCADKLFVNMDQVLEWAEN